MSPELKTRVTSTVVMSVIGALVTGLGAVLESDSFRPFLLENGFSSLLATLTIVFLYQFVAYILNRIPASTTPPVGGETKITSWLGRI